MNRVGDGSDEISTLASQFHLTVWSRNRFQDAMVTCLFLDEKSKGLWILYFGPVFNGPGGHMRSRNATETLSSYCRLELEETLTCIPVLYALADALVLSHRRHSEVKLDRKRHFIFLVVYISVCFSRRWFTPSHSRI